MRVQIVFILITLKVIPAESTILQKNVIMELTVLILMGKLIQMLKMIF